MIIQINMGVGGFYRFRKGRIAADGSEYAVVEYPGVSANLVTVGGLNMIGSATDGDYFNGCHVGTSNTANTIDGTTGAATNTSLVSYLAGTITVQSNGTAAQASEPYYGYRIKVFRFAAGVATGNVSEVGIAQGTSSPVGIPGSAGNSAAPLFSRALIVDEFGTPVTITVEAEEFLDVTYEYRLYPPLTDVTGTTTIASVSTDYTLRAASVTSNTFWGAPLGQPFGAVGGFSDPQELYDGAIGAITSTPAGSLVGFSGDDTALAYSTDNYYRDLYIVFGISQGTVDVTSVLLRTTLGAYQIQFTPVIPKRNTNELRITLRIAWSIHTP